MSPPLRDPRINMILLALATLAGFIIGNPHTHPIPTARPALVLTLPQLQPGLFIPSAGGPPIAHTE